MIDAQAVSAQLEKLGDLPSKAQDSEHPVGLAWMEGALQGLPFGHDRDTTGNLWITVTGKGDRAVLLGSYIEGAGQNSLDSHLGLVTGLETLKALAHRYGTDLPCTVQLVAWASSQAAASAQQSGSASTWMIPQNVAAYLELHVEPGSELGENGTPLGVGTALEGEISAFHPRLSALCDEAIRELTGTSAALPLQLSPIAAEVARTGIPTAAMYVQSVGGTAARDLPSEKRLHLLQAAESFGRWAEATTHLVGGDPVDLWAREHRLPHN